MSSSLQGFHAVVSGSTAGIGHAIALQLAQAGAEVVVNGRSQARVDAALASLRAAVPGGVFHGVAADLASAAGAESFIAAVPQTDILVNNLGIFAPVDFADITDAQWDEMWQANVMSGVRLARHYFPGMLARDRGRVIFVSSESALQIPVEMVHYGVSKAAQVALARGMAQSTAGSKVTVNSVLAGPTSSEGVGTFVNQLAEQEGVSKADFEQQFFKTARPGSLLQRFTDPAEIASVVAFVASPASSAINGAAIRAEGGLVQSAF